MSSGAMRRHSLTPTQHCRPFEQTGAGDAADQCKPRQRRGHWHSVTWAWCAVGTIMGPLGPQQLRNCPDWQTTALCPTLQFLDRYLSAAAGPHKWPKLVDFLRTTYARITADLAQRQQNQVWCVRLG